MEAAGEAAPPPRFGLYGNSGIKVYINYAGDGACVVS